MAKMKSPLVAFVGLAVLSLLTGCVEKFGGGPNALSRDGDELLVAVCVGIDARELYGSVQGDDGERPFLDLEGAAWIETGSILRPGVLDGFEGYFNSVNAQSIHALNLKFEGVGKGASWASSFGADGPITIPEDGWLQTSGETTESPCP